MASTPPSVDKVWESLRSISPVDLEQQMSVYPKKFILLDLRTRQEYDTSHIYTAINFGYDPESTKPVVLTEAEEAVFPASSRQLFRHRREYDLVIICAANVSSPLAAAFAAAILQEHRNGDLFLLFGGYNLYKRLYPALCIGDESADPHLIQQIGKLFELPLVVEIIPNLLYQSDELASYDCRRLDMLQITAIINACNDLADSFPGLFEYLDLPFDEFPEDEIIGMLDTAFLFIDKIRSSDGRVLVHCLRGSNRSTAVVIAYLMRAYHWSVEQALVYVRSRNPNACPNIVFLRRLVSYEAYLKSLWERYSEEQQGEMLPLTTPALNDESMRELMEEMAFVRNKFRAEEEQEESTAQRREGISEGPSAANNAEQGEQLEEGSLC